MSHDFSPKQYSPPPDYWIPMERTLVPGELADTTNEFQKEPVLPPYEDAWYEAYQARTVALSREAVLTQLLNVLVDRSPVSLLKAIDDACCLPNEKPALARATLEQSICLGNDLARLIATIVDRMAREGTDW